MSNNEVIKFIKNNNFFPSKKLGQNFLLSSDYKKRIVDAASITENDFVLEIGPGFGALTDYIIQKTKNVTLVEFDKRLYEFLVKKYTNLNIINYDILKFDLNQVLDNQYSKSIVISNLPYSISSQVLINLLKTFKVDSMVLMVQKEMADRITSKIGSKKYNGFSILISLLADVEKLFDVPPNVFHPEPHVTSTVIRVIPKKDINFDVKKMEKFLKICFLNKRKKLLNNLKTIFDQKTIYNCFDDLKIDINIRPEELNMNQYVQLIKELKYGN